MFKALISLLKVETNIKNSRETKEEKVEGNVNCFWLSEVNLWQYFGKIQKGVHFILTVLLFPVFS